MLARNAEFVHQHKEELEKGSKAFKITGLAFLARGIANIINSGGVQMENLDSFAFGAKLCDSCAYCGATKLCAQVFSCSMPTLR